MTGTRIRGQIVKAVEDVRTKNPLVGSVTNAVTMNMVANAQLAVGGSAAVVYLQDEGEFLVKASDAFYINVGTLLPLHETSLPPIARSLHETRTPWVLDPVAIGIGEMRNSLLTEFKEYRPDVIRGNASEIIALAGLWGLEGNAGSNVRGVDSTDTVDGARDAAVALARWTGGAVAVSGKEDMVTDGSTIVRSEGGSDMMERITGSGCSLGGVTAVYAAVASPFIAALTATSIYNLAGRRAAQSSNGPGMFQWMFLDELYRATADDVADNPMRMEEAE